MCALCVRFALEDDGLQKKDAKKYEKMETLSKNTLTYTHGIVNTSSSRRTCNC